jgi:uncharacterized protein (TIGR00730 family)
MELAQVEVSQLASFSQLVVPQYTSSCLDQAVQLARQTLAAESCGEEILMEVVDEFVRGMELLSNAPQRITVFGAARCSEEQDWYALGREVGKAVAEAGYTVLTGGGPGLMEAANRGAADAEGYSIGFNIELPFEQKPNLYLNEVLDFKHFFVRKALLRWETSAIIALPGGFGTFDELFETLTLRQTHKMPDIPIVLIGREFWSPLLEFLQRSPEAEGFVSHDDISGLVVFDTADEALRYIKQYHAAKEMPAALAA